MCVDRMLLTRTSPYDHTVCGSFLGPKVIVLINSAGPPAVRVANSEWRWAISPDWMNASATCATNLLQLIAKPCGETISELQTASSFGPVPWKDQRSWTRSGKPSV